MSGQNCKSRPQSVASGRLWLVERNYESSVFKLVTERGSAYTDTGYNGGPRAMSVGVQDEVNREGDRCGYAVPKPARVWRSCGRRAGSRPRVRG
jgi:hypothetical protein